VPDDKWGKATFSLAKTLEETRSEGEISFFGQGKDTTTPLMVSTEKVGENTRERRNFPQQPWEKKLGRKEEYHGKA